MNLILLLLVLIAVSSSGVLGKKRRKSGAHKDSLKRSHHRFEDSVANDNNENPIPQTAVSCEPPCRVCAEWENSCILPEAWTPYEAKAMGIMHFVNPKTGEQVYRNRSYEANPFPFSSRLKAHHDWRVEYRIIEMFLRVLQKAESQEPMLRKIIAQHNEQSRNEKMKIDLDELTSVEWMKHANSVNKQLESALENFEGNNQLAEELFGSPSRVLLMNALASPRFLAHQLRYFDVVYETYLDMVEELQLRNDPPISQHTQSTCSNHRKPTTAKDDKCAIILDDRASRSLPLSIKHTLRLLNLKEEVGGRGAEEEEDGISDWTLVIFHTDNNEELLRSSLANITRPLGSVFAKGSVGSVSRGHEADCNSRIKTPVVFRKVKALSWDKASALRASSAFYRAMPDHCQRLLIFEDDAILRVPGSRLEPFMNFPSIGAPFRWCSEQWCRYGGNGGATVRNKEVMLDVYTEIRCTTDWSCESVDLFRDTEFVSGTTFNTEDVFLAKQLFQSRSTYGAYMPTFAEATAFSVETMYNPDPAWAHKVWRYLHPINAIELIAAALAQYPITKSET